MGSDRTSPSLGAKLGEGAGSEVFAFGDGKVVKLFKEPADRRVVQHEVRVTRAAFQAHAPAPEVLDVVEVQGRPGIVFPRFDGQTLLKQVMKGSIGPAAAGELLARVHHSLHAPGYQASLMLFRQWGLFYIHELRKRGIAGDVLDVVERTLMRLPEGGTLCHGDLHADNILITANGPVIIDWVSALNANPLVDIARQHLTLAILPDAAATIVERWDAVRLEVHSSFISTYAELTGSSSEQLRNAIAPYVVVMAATRMMESASTALERRRLADYIRSSGAADSSN